MFGRKTKALQADLERTNATVATFCDQKRSMLEQNLSMRAAILVALDEVDPFTYPHVVEVLTEAVQSNGGPCAHHNSVIAGWDEPRICSDCGAHLDGGPDG